MVTHTLNLRLHPDDLTYIATHAGDRVLIVDKVLWPLVENFSERVGFEHVIAIGDGPTPDGAIEYEELLASGTRTTSRPRDRRALRRRHVLHERHDRAAEGRPLLAPRDRPPLARLAHGGRARRDRGRHRPAGRPDVPRERLGLPLHVHARRREAGLPGPHLDGPSLLDAFQQEQVTITAGVPTIWMGILQELDASPGTYDTSSVRAMIVGGSAAPQAMIEAFEKRHGLRILHAWGMTETCPLGSVSELTTREQALPEDEQYRYRAKQGIPAPFVEIRARGADGLVPWDGETMGELEVRGVWVASSYYEDRPRAPTAGRTTAGSRPATS